MFLINNLINFKGVGMDVFNTKLVNFNTNLSAFMNTTGETFSGNVTWINNFRTDLQGKNTLLETSPASL